MKYRFLVLLVIVLFPMQCNAASVTIEKWKGGKQAALLMYFFDSTPGQAELAIPLLNNLGLVGTFFVNPGSDSYENHKSIWEIDSQMPNGCQELANHTMNHHGANNHDEAVYEIAEPSRIIWQARGHEEKGSFIAFNKGGGTSWSGIGDEELENILSEYKNIEYTNTYIGEPMVGTQILPGSDSVLILRNKQQALDEGKILMLSFHGIAQEDGNPPYDHGNGAVYIEDFREAMNILKEEENLFWSGGYTQVYKYIQERKNTDVQLIKQTSSEYIVTLNCPLDRKFFNEPLTLAVSGLPDNWDTIQVIQNYKALSFHIKENILYFDAVPDPLLPVSIIKDEDVTYYVSPFGDDANSGTEDLPLKTITAALNKLTGGGSIIAEDGFYNEYININKSGTEQNPIKIMARNKRNAKCIGFRILHANSHISIDGFEIESDMATAYDKKGIMNYGGDNVSIVDCYIHDCPAGGIAIIQNAANAKIQRNVIDHNGFYGIYIDGNHGLIEGNIISKIVQNHPKFSQSQVPNGADADGIVIFGNNHIIRKNKILDLAFPQSENTNPHADGIQSSSNNTNTVLQDSKIYQNYIRINYPSGKGILLEANKKHPCRNVIIANNIIEFADIGVSASYNGGIYRNIRIVNNVFKSGLNLSSWGTAVWLRNNVDYQFVNNITVDCKNEHRKITGGTGVVNYNLAYNSDNSYFSMTPPANTDELVGISPEFKKYTGIHGENNYSLKKTSPAIRNGRNLSYTDKAFLYDYEGNFRSEDMSWDIGAYKYTPKKNTSEKRPIPVILMLLE